MLVCTLPSPSSSLQRAIIDGQGNDDVRFSPDKSRAYRFIPPAFGLQHRRFKFQSPAEIEGDDLKKKLNSGYHLCSPPCARPGSNSTQKTSLSHKHEPTGCQKRNKYKAPGFLCKCCPKRRKRFSTLKELITSVRFVEAALKTRTKPSVTKIRSIYAAAHGLAQRSLSIIMRFTFHYTVLKTLIFVASVGMNLHGKGRVSVILRLNTYSRFIRLGNATVLKDSTASITSNSISIIFMQAGLENGPLCWRTAVCRWLEKSRTTHRSWVYERCAF
ncbi:hypothetical protein FVEG_07002 [Fusarium verticillioides 7600]|uniref:C2H2-type zinc finger ascomycetes domain-containing protein n=1 Tax=Gibberella moniliformis (strain M3125 / FGSC 7600) TaxID=334819 RepID=W7MG22_GIBM7|nr:hypothetical protein FVEG_07002 [Fusarium verticillioides 7600]EWG46569.1 hypothetical protein FVEG_07002 [Fusarium verticillioides 7600]